MNILHWCPWKFYNKLKFHFILSNPIYCTCPHPRHRTGSFTPPPHSLHIHVHTRTCRCTWTLHTHTYLVSVYRILHWYFNTTLQMFYLLSFIAPDVCFFSFHISLINNICSGKKEVFHCAGEPFLTVHMTINTLTTSILPFFEHQNTVPMSR